MLQHQEDSWSRYGLHRPAANLEPRLVLSVDVEDWPQSTFNRSLPITERAGRNASHVLDLLARHNRRATLFVLGLFAERFSDLVRRMASEGHEIASHGYGHVPITLQSQRELRQDVRRAKALLEDIIGVQVLGYRAPDFSIVPETLWALDVIADEGYVYDSSIFPIAHKRYGMSDWPVEPAWITTKSGQALLEVPIATLDWGGRRWPVGGGGYHRLLPWAAIRTVIAHVLRQGRIFMSYCHPYEFDTREMHALRLEVPLGLRLHQGLGRRGFERKFERMLAAFPGAPARETVVAATRANAGIEHGLRKY